MPTLRYGPWKLTISKSCFHGGKGREERSEGELHLEQGCEDGFDDMDEGLVWVDG